MADGKIKINELPETTLVADSDIFIIENDSTTQKISMGSLINYIKEHEEIAKYFVKQSAVDSENGIAPLDSNRKIPSTNLPFGTTENTIYDGALGQTLANNLSLLEENFYTTTENLQNQINNIDSSSGEVTTVSAMPATLTYPTDLGDAQIRKAYYYNNFLYVNLYFLSPKVTGVPTFAINMKADGYEEASTPPNIAVMYFDNSAMKIVATTTINGILNIKPHMTSGTPLFINFVLPVRKI